MLDTLYDKVCQLLSTGQWFSPGTPVSSTNKTDHQDITEILLKLALSTLTPGMCLLYSSELLLWNVFIVMLLTDTFL
jgi:hypothetical protein